MAVSTRRKDLLVALAVVVLILVACLVLIPRPGYLGVECASVTADDDRVLNVAVLGGQSTFGEGVEVSETASEVILRGRGFQLWGASTAIGIPKWFVVQLESPLGARVLLAEGPPAWPTPTPVRACTR